MIFNKVGIFHLTLVDYLEETEHRFELNTIECSKVFSLLSKLCKSKATGLDKISARLLRVLIWSPALFAVSLIDLLYLVYFPQNGNLLKSFHYSNRVNAPI